MPRPRKDAAPPPPPGETYEPTSLDEAGQYKALSRQHSGNTAGNPLGPKAKKHRGEPAPQDEGGAQWEQWEEPPPLHEQRQSAQQQSMQPDTDRITEKSRRDRNWRRVMGGKRSELLRLSPLYAAWWEEDCTQLQQKLQERINMSFIHHTCGRGQQECPPQVRHNARA